MMVIIIYLSCFIFLMETSSSSTPVVSYGIIKLAKAAMHAIIPNDIKGPVLPRENDALTIQDMHIPTKKNNCLFNKTITFFLFH